MNSLPKRNYYGDDENDWQQEHMQTVQDISRVSSLAIQGMKADGDQFKNALEAQDIAADAVMRQAIALKERSEAMKKLYNGDTADFVAKYGDSLETTRTSIRSASQWVSHVNSNGLYDSFGFALSKISAVDQDFSKRNSLGLRSLAEKVEYFTANVDALINKTKENIQSTVQSVSAKLASFADATMKMLSSVQGEIKNNFNQNVAIANGIKDGIKTSIDQNIAVAKGVTFKAGNFLKTAVERGADTFAVTGAVIGGMAKPIIDKTLGQANDAYKERLSNRYWDAIKVSYETGSTADLDRQIKTYGQQNIAICGRDNEGCRNISMAGFMASRIVSDSKSYNDRAIENAGSVIDCLVKNNAMNLDDYPEAKAIIQSLNDKNGTSIGELALASRPRV